MSDAATIDTSLFESASVREADALTVQLAEYDGPLHVLLDLARRQKVDLKQIRVVELAEQYLLFIANARRLKLSLAADYLVMAAWLGYLKSRLLLPSAPDDDEPDGEEMAAHIAFQLQRLDAMRRAAGELFERAQLGRDFFGRGEPERRRITTRVEWRATQHDLFMAYSRQKTKESFKPLHLARRSVVTLDDALARLRRNLDASASWEKLYAYLPEEWRSDDHARSAVASTFAAALELAKLGQVRLRQDEHFAPIEVRVREDAAGGGVAPGADLSALLGGDGGTADGGVAPAASQIESEDR